jgi:low temperature requirement protein LtrA
LLCHLVAVIYIKQHVLKTICVLFFTFGFAFILNSDLCSNVEVSFIFIMLKFVLFLLSEYDVLCNSEGYLLSKPAEGRNHVSVVVSLEVGFPLPQFFRPQQCID